MLTYPCMVVLKHLKKLTDNTDRTISYLYNTTFFCLEDNDKQTYDYRKYQNEIESIIDELVNNGFLNYNGNIYNFSLTQKGLHKTFLTVQSSVLFLIQNFALPIIVSFVTTMITLCITGQL